jgi:hypothetical protein
MHRVYNSAFMNMLRDEKNQEYRLVIKNTLEFDPQILKRYVNFMNNPDERTAIDQFGKGDKYFGVCVLLATLPGLPMFGHGQIEGFTEKYGMEYRRAYWDELPDRDLIARHEQVIFPLLRKRYLFAEADHFFLYDFETAQGYVNEDVFAYSNRIGAEKALVVYHNRFAETDGFIKTSCAYLQKDAQGERKLIRSSPADQLEIHDDEQSYTILRDAVSGLEFIWNNHDIHQHGLYLQLRAYEFHVFLEFQTVRDTPDGLYRQLTAELNGKGVPSIEQALQEKRLQPVRQALRELLNPGQLNWLIQHRQCTEDELLSEKQSSVIAEIEHKAAVLSQKIENLFTKPLATDRLQDDFACACQTLLSPAQLAVQSPTVDKLCQGDSYTWSTLLGWMFLAPLGHLQETQPQKALQISWQWFREWKLENLLEDVFRGMLLTETEIQRALLAVQILLKYPLQMEENIPSPENNLALWFSDGSFRQFIGVNHYQGTDWFVKEAFEEWLDLMSIAALITWRCMKGEESHPFLAALEPFLSELKHKALLSRYQLREFLQLCKLV